MAQVLLREILPRFDIEQLVDEFKQSNENLKAILEALETYSGKHIIRADRNLKRTFYVRYVLSQMTLLEDKKQSTLDKEGQADGEEAQTASTKKRDRKA